MDAIAVQLIENTDFATFSHEIYEIRNLIENKYLTRMSMIPRNLQQKSSAKFRALLIPYSYFSCSGIILRHVPTIAAESRSVAGGRSLRPQSR